MWMKWMRRKQGMRAKLGSEGVHAFLKGGVSCFERRCFHLKRENLSTFFLRDKASINKESVRGT
jgi:hypothetical protein